MAIKGFSFEEWLLTEHGKKCNSTSDERIVQPYLRNRLWWAFDAGSESGLKDIRLQDTIDWYEQKLKEQKHIQKKLVEEINRLKQFEPCTAPVEK